MSQGQLSQTRHIRTLANDGAWCFFADPRAVSFTGKFKRTYVGWVTKTGDIRLGFYDHHTQQIESITVKERLQRDDHANPALFITDEGYIMIFYSAHNGSDLFYRISEIPEDISCWGEERKLLDNSEGRHGFTYPNPIQLKNESNNLYLFWRGGNFKPTYATTQDGIHWRKAKTLIQGPGARPYVKYATNDQDKIYFAFTDGHPNEERGNSIYCAYYHHGAIYKPDGEKIKDIAHLPIDPSEADQVYDAKGSGKNAWVWDIALDSDDHPVVVYAVFHSPHDHRYRYARWFGTKWVDNEITSSGSWFPETPLGKDETEPYYSGGIILDHTNPAVVYLSKEVNGVFEIEKWETTNYGKSWSSQAITRQSTANNVRPVVSRGSMQHEALLFWMQGQYIHYVNYNTELKLLTDN